MKLSGPANPFAILDIARSEHAGGVSRAAMTYPDGVMIETRYRMPVTPGYMLATADLVPIDSHMISTATEEEADGTYCYFTFWCPASSRGKSLTCPDTPSGVRQEFDLCKTVVVA